MLDAPRIITLSFAALAMSHTAQAETQVQLSVIQPAACEYDILSATSTYLITLFVACNTNARIELRSSRNFGNEAWVEFDSERAPASTIVTFPVAPYPKGRTHRIKYSEDISASDFTIEIAPATY